MQGLSWAWVEGNGCLLKLLPLVEGSGPGKLGFPEVWAGNHPHEYAGSPQFH